MDWTKILWAVLLGAMVVFLWPRAMHMLKNSPKATGDDWRSFMIPMAMVVIFIVFLVMMVRH